MVIDFSKVKQKSIIQWTGQDRSKNMVKCHELDKLGIITYFKMYSSMILQIE